MLKSCDIFIFIISRLFKPKFGTYWSLLIRIE